MDILNTKIKNVLQEKTLKIRPENIKDGVTAFGITGTYTGEQTGGGKNIQNIIGMYVTTYTTYTKSGMKLTCAKSGTYTIRWLCQRMSTSGVNGSALYINDTQYGSNYETWGLTYWRNNAEYATPANMYVMNEVQHVTLNENDVVELWSKSNANGNFLYNHALILEEE